MEREVTEVHKAKDLYTTLIKSETNDVANDTSNIRAPYASFIHHCNSIKVLPKLTRKPSNVTSNSIAKPSVNLGMNSGDSTSVQRIVASLETSTSTGVSKHGMEKTAESTVPSALGLLRTTSLPESPVTKPILHNIQLPQNPAAVSLSRESILDVRKRKLVPARPMNTALANKSLNFRTIKTIFSFLKNCRRHKWLTCEWFESLLESHILKSPTRFQRQMEKIVPPTCNVGLNILEWSYLRTKMRSVRRFSSAFLKDERKEWKRIILTIRLLQNKEIFYIKDTQWMEDIPRSIPKILPKGSVVQVLVVNPFRGVHRAAVVEYEPHKFGYFVQFLAPLVNGMMKQSVFIPDNQLMFLQDHETLDLQFLNMKETNALVTDYHMRIGESTCINTYAIKPILALWALLRMRQRQERLLYRFFYLNNKVMKIVEKEDSDLETHPSEAKILGKYQRILTQLEDLHLGILHNMRIVENFRDELKYRSISPMGNECSASLLIESCRLSCVSYVDEYMVGPIEPYLRGRIGQYLMVFKFLQTIGCNNRGRRILKLQLHQLYLSLNEESSQLFLSAFLPLIERYVKEVESLSLPS